MAAQPPAPVMQMAVLQISPVERFSMAEASDRGHRWERWKKSFEMYLLASSVQQDIHKKALLLHSAGSEVQELFSTLILEDETYSKTVECLDKYFIPQKNVPYERHLFRQTVQSEGETVNSFVTQLKQLISSCGYAVEQQDDVIRDQVIEKCCSRQLRVRLLREHNLKLPRLLDMARAHEAAETQARQMEVSVTKQEQVCQVMQGHNQQFRQTKGTNSSDSGRPVGVCWNCGQRGHIQRHCKIGQICNRCGDVNHIPDECPVRDWKCNRCHRVGHIARVCRSRYRESGRQKTEGHPKETFRKKLSRGSSAKVNCLNECESDSSDSDDNDHVFHLYEKGDQNMSLPFTYFDINGQSVKCLIDSGATCNVMNCDMADRLNVTVVPCKSTRKIQPYEAESIKVQGQFEAVVTKGDRKVKTTFLVVKGSSVPLVGFKTATDMEVLSVCTERDEDCVNRVEDQSV